MMKLRLMGAVALTATLVLTGCGDKKAGGDKPAAAASVVTFCTCVRRVAGSMRIRSSVTGTNVSSPNSSVVLNPVPSGRIT